MGPAEIITILCATGIFLVLGGYPLLLWLWCLRTPLADNPTDTNSDSAPPSITLIVVVHNGENLIDNKLTNTLALDYPPDRLQVLVCSDGSTDSTSQQVTKRGDLRIRLLESAQRQGKNLTLNAGVATCDSDMLVFSDADARLHPQALKWLMAPMADPGVGGVCGQRVIGRDTTDLSEPQQDYIRFDSAIKKLESDLGSITSNDGKLYAMRRRLYRGMARAVTDDLYNCLQVVDQGYRFVFAPRALAFIRTPSRNPAHELIRRRRIIARSLNGIGLMHGLLNPWRNFQFATGLLINKLLRRLLPVLLAGLLIGSLAGALHSHWLALLLLGQAAFYGAALLHRMLRPVPLVGHVAEAALYFSLGNYATLLGMLDFLRGVRPDVWEPVKSDSAAPSDNTHSG